MLLPLATEPRTNMLNEIFTLLSDNQKECPPAQAFWESLHNTDRVRDFIPIPKDPKPKYHLEWTHKKGKRKPQQFWIYCEESQQNYVRVEFKASGFCWSQKSAVFIHKQTNSIVLIENFEEEDTQAIHRCLVCSLSGEETNFSVQHLPTNELERVAFSDLQIVFKIVADAEFPVHPHQGKPEEVRIHQNILHDKDLPFPFCYVGKFTFKNREEGWFRLEATLQYKEHEIFTGTSDLFMFNNPRMKKKKHLAAFEPAEIKFMQVYALNSCTDQDYWFDLGMQLGYGSTRCLQLLSLAPQMFSKVNSRSSSISIPSGMASSTVKFAANSKKRSSPHSLSGSPPRKMPCIEPTARKLSLPAMKLESSCASSNSFNEKKSNAKNFRRVISGPASSSLNPCNLDEFSSTVVPNILNSLAQCPTVDKVEHFEKSIYYQFLTEKLTLKDTNFSLLPCKSTLSIDQLVIRIAQQAKNNKVSHNGIRHLYARDHNTVVELTDTMDLHALFAREKNPVILVSTHDDENTPSRLLFSASTPSFRLRGR